MLKSEPSHVADVWGFDEEAVEVLKNMKPQEDSDDLIRKYAILLDQGSELLPENASFKQNVSIKDIR